MQFHEFVLIHIVTLLLVINSKLKWCQLNFQDELTLSLKSLQDKLESLKRIQRNSEDVFKYIKVSCNEMAHLMYLLRIKSQNVELFAS